MAALAAMPGCMTVAPDAPEPEVASRIDRLTWGVNDPAFDAAHAQQFAPYLQAQLHARPAVLPAAVQAQIDAMTISRQPMDTLVVAMEEKRKAANGMADPDKKAAQQAYQQELNLLAREAASRHLLRAVYSDQQVLEEMTWFWMNHFSVFQGKQNIRAMLGDYEEHAIRDHALGHFRDLLGAVAHHPAMLRFLDNEQNAVGHVNENYARELMELHTLGVDGGYTQADVQELARVLTGVGINLTNTTPQVRKDRQAFYVRRGLFEFNPNRHDFGPKQLLGQPIHARGLGELDEALDRLAHQPATARFISRKLAVFWVSDAPSPQLVQAMAATFTRTDGDIAQTLQTMFATREFWASHKFKDPTRFVVSAVRAAYDGRPILNTAPMVAWLNRLGEPLYGRQTPDGYPLDSASWSSAGQMNTRFEIARAIGSNNAGLFRAEGAEGPGQPAFPQLSNAIFYNWRLNTLGAATRQALAEAGSPQEWNTFLLSSPEFMQR